MSAEPKESMLRKLARRLIIGTMLVGVLAAAVWFAYMYGGQALCEIAIGQIAEITNTRIETDSVTFHANGSVVIEGLAISPFKRQGPNDAILRAEHVYGRFNPGSLLRMNPRLQQIDVNDFVCNARYDEDTEQWNLSALKLTIPRGGSETLPDINLRRGELRYTRVAGENSEIAATMPLAMSFGAIQQQDRVYAFTLTTGTQVGGYGQSQLTGTWKPGSLTLAGGIASEILPELEMAWTVDLLAAELLYDDNDDYELELRLKDLYSRQRLTLERVGQIGPDVLTQSACFKALQKFLRRYEPHGRADIQLSASGNFERWGRSRLAGTLECRDTAIRYHKFDYPVDAINGAIDFTHDSVTLNNLHGKHKDVNLFFNGWSKGFGADWQYDLHVTSDDMVLDRDMYLALNETQKKLWDSLAPCGVTSVDYHMRRESPTDKTQMLALDLQNVQATYGRMPYPLYDLTGRVRIRKDSIQFADVTSESNDRKIVVNGAVTTAPGGEKEYLIRIDANNVPLDRTLHASLPDGQKGLYEQFDPNGLIDAAIVVSGSPEMPDTYTADLQLKQGAVDHDDLPFSLSDVTARLICTPTSIEIRRMVGRHGETAIDVNGMIDITPRRDEHLYDLTLNLANAEINDDLLDCLPEAARRRIAAMKPEGNLDLHITLDTTDSTGPTAYHVGIRCLGNSLTVPEFPYPLQDARGTIVVLPDKITIESISAVPGPAVGIVSQDSAVRLSGEITLADGAMDTATLDIKADDIFFESQLARAMPGGLRVLYDRLLPSGRFGLDLSEVRITQLADGTRDVAFDGKVRLDKCLFRITGARTEADNADLNVRGMYRHERGISDCVVDIDAQSLKIQDKALTDLTARLTYDQTKQRWFTDDIAADCYGGKLLGSFDFNQPEQGPIDYLLQVAFDNLDMKDFLADTRFRTEGENDHTSGKMQGSLALRATTGDSNSRIGKCKLSITEMKVGKLSPLVRLFQVLKLSLPTEFAFDEMYLDSYIKKSDLIVQKLDLAGESLAFYGSGRMDLETRNVDLTLTGRGKRLATADPSLWESLTENIGKAMVRIDVSGSFYDPRVETKPLPIITETLDLFGKAVTSSNGQHK